MRSEYRLKSARPRTAAYHSEVGARATRAPVDVKFGHFEARVANAVVPNARLCARYTSPDVICRVFSHLHRVSCAVVHSRRRTSEKVSHLPDCLFSSLWWLSIEVISPRRRRLNDMTRMCMVETKSSCRFCGTHRDFRDRAIGHLTYICPKMAFFPSAATSLLQFGGCS